MRETGLEYNAGPLNLISVRNYLKRLEFDAEINSREWDSARLREQTRPVEKVSTGMPMPLKVLFWAGDRPGRPKSGLPPAWDS